MIRRGGRLSVKLLILLLKTIAKVEISKVWSFC